jgi:MSHA biogenesis protein MshQ
VKLLALFRLWCLCLLLAPLQVGAVTYANTSYAFNWVDASAHAKLGYNTSPHKFYGLSGCGTTPPTIDDTISDEIPIGFSFLYAGVGFTSLRVMSNGRVQFNNNTTCGYGSPVQQLPYPNSTLNYTMRIYGNDLDPTSKVDVSAYNTNCLSKSVCYVSYATIGVAPYRSFVVTWNNVPEWTTGSNPTGSYNLQLILQENGEFIYQYGADTPGPSAALGQVGWQVDSADYDTPQTGFPINNTAIKFYIPQPVAEYRMEQTSWASSAVIDTSGNGRNGTALGSAQTIANGKVCRAGNFPGSIGVNSIDAIDTGVSIPATVGGAGTITFWYRGNSAWTGVSAQLLDATVAKDQWFSLTRRSNGRLLFVMTDAEGVVRSVETGNNTVAANTWKHIAISWNFNALGAANSDHLRIYIDGVLQSQSSFSTTYSLSASIGTLYVGDNRSTFTGPNGSSNSANGAVDELRVYNYEGGVALVQRDFNQGGAGCLSHYAITNAGTGVTCQQNTVTVFAHDASHALITMPNNTTTLQLSTSSGKGDWALINGYGVLNNGAADDGLATYLFNGEYQAVFALTHGTADNVNINVSDGQFTESATEDPLLVISACHTNGFNACELSAPRCVPSSSSTTYARLNTELANAAFKFDVVKLRTNGTLETTFNGSANVDLLANSSSVAVGSNNCPVSQTAIIPLGSVAFTSGYGPASGVNVAANAFASVSPGYAAYRDVRVRFSCSAANCGSAMVACSTDNYAVRPSGFTVTSTANADVSGSSTTASPVIKAGANFALTATAVSGYSATPKIDASKVSAHSGAVRSVSPAGVFGGADLATGIATGTFTYAEVGYFNFMADGVYDDSFSAVDSGSGDCTDDFSNVAVSGKYGCKFGNVAASSYFGRFIPDHFAITLPVLTAACPSATPFSYFGQDGYATAFTLTAQDSSNATTQNYHGSFAKLNLANYASYGFTAVTLPSGSVLSSSATAPTGTWSSGVANVTARHQISRPTALTAETTLITRAAPGDGEVSTATPIALGSGGAFRYGRLWLGNAYGSDKKSLALPYQTQFWDGRAFIANTLDNNCTSLAASNVVLANRQGGLGSYNGPVSVSSTSVGVGTITLPAPGQSGSVDLLLALGASGTPSNCYNLTGGTAANLAHLSGKWCGASYDRNPVARATFGISVTSRQIDMREGY